MAKTQPSNATGGGDRKRISQGRSKGKRVQVSKAMMKQHGRHSKGNKRVPWLLTAGR